MASNLIEKIRKSRETQVMVSGLNLTICYPTMSEVFYSSEAANAILKLTNGKGKQADFDVVLGFIEAHVTGWIGATELDFFSGGTGEKVEFSRELFHEWLIDSGAENWAKIYSEITSFSVRAVASREAAVKN